MTPTLSLSGSFCHSDLDSLCEELAHLRRWPSDEPSRIDLSELGALEPTTLAVLLAALRGLRMRQAWDPLAGFVAPESGHATRCLAPAALRALVTEGVGHWQADGGEEPAVLGSEPFVGNRGVDRVLASLHNRLAAETDWSARSLRAFSTLVYELTQNVIQHSGDRGGVVVLEVLPARGRVSLAIADSGIGVQSSLVQNPEFSDIGDDLTAIKTAMGPRASGEPGTGGGMGLYLARLLVRDNGGRFLLRSGDASREECETVSDLTQLPHLYGTLISIELRTDLPLDYGRIETSLGLPVRQRDLSAAT